MNKKWVVAMFSVFLVLVTVLRAQAALKDGVIGYWPMDNASMPEQNLAGTTTLSSSSGAAMFNSSCVVNGCYEFSSGTYYDFGNNALFDFPTQSFTVSFWCYSPSGANTNVVTSKFDGVSGWRAYCMGNNGYNTLLLQAYNSGVEKINTQSGTYDWNTWWYVTYIVDRTSNRAYLYVNGTMRVNNSVGGDVGTGGDFVIGAYTAGNNPFVGFLDELAIWNRSLSDSEVVEVFSNASWFSSGGSPPSVVKNVSLNNVFADSYFLVPPSNTTIYANFSSINVSIINVTGIIGSEVQFVQNYSDVWSFVLQSDVAALLNLTNVSAFDNESNRYDFTVFLQVNWTVPAGPVDNQNKSACFVANESITYFVVSNITDSTGNCVLVTASNVVVDLLGNTIFGGSDSSPSSVFRVLQADGVSNLTVKNGFVLNSDKRVFDTWTTLDVINVHVLNGSLSLYPTGGIYFLFRNSTRIFNSSVDANLGMTMFSGMISMSQHNNLLNNVVVTGNSRYGVRVSGTVLSAINGSTTIVDSALNVSDGVDVNAYGVTNFFVINSTLMGMVGWSEYTGATRRANLTIDTLSLFVGQNSGDVVFLNSLYSGFKNKQYYMNGSGVVMLSDVWSDSSRITKLVNGVFNSTVLPVGNRFSFSQDFGAYSELNISLGPNNVPSIPVLVSPANNSVLNVSEVFFNWSASDFEGDALNYALYLNSSLVLNINVSHFNLSYVANGNY